MKKVLFTAMAAVAMFAMVACNNNKTQEAVAEDTTATEQCVKQCDKACADTCMCGEECAAAKCEGCPNHGTENCCKAKATVEGQACEKACEHKCQKAEGQECQKACEKKCEKAQ